jgi:A118 family predicted phage portal protein
MPLPVSDTTNVWPPQKVQDLLPAMEQWSAWWANSIERLQIAYGGGSTGDSTGFFASDTGGTKVHSLGPISWFVGKAVTGTERNTKVPIPIAAEICQASADLLFSDPLSVTVTDDTTQKRITEILNDSFHSTVAEGAETCAALGGVYLRATWDDTVTDMPFTTIKDADTAIPEFRWGRLQAVTFWNVIAVVGKLVYRHLERHELGSAGNGIILHGLYEGEADKLGTRVSLTMRAETASMALYVDVNGVEGSIDTKSVGLAVTYVPNQTPNRIWRKHDIGRNLGRSDLDGIEHLMDQLAENTSDWMRARRAARARVMYSKDLAKNGGPGNGQFVNPDQENYVPVSYSGMSGGKDAKLSDMVEVLQPEFDPTGYKMTGEMLAEQILQMAGYSMQTFGVNPEGGGERTATEIESKERRSLMTRSRKIREWKPAITEHILKLLAIDNEFFGHKNILTALEVEFSDGVQESQIKLGQFVLSLYSSESASVDERVEILHPDWDDEQKSAEVTKIKAEFAQPLPEPAVDPFDDPAADPAA